MRKILLTAFLALITTTGTIAFVFAHPGRTDSSGCHTCRTNCANWGLSTGEYHCHRAKALPQPKEPIHSRYGEGGTGYTEPAPEYKKPTLSDYEPVPIFTTTTEPKPASVETKQPPKYQSTYNYSSESTNDGFGAVILILTALGGGGYYLWKNKHKQ